MCNKTKKLLEIINHKEILKYPLKTLFGCLDRFDSENEGMIEDINELCFMIL